METYARFQPKVADPSSTLRVSTLDSPSYPRVGSIVNRAKAADCMDRPAQLFVGCLRSFLTTTTNDCITPYSQIVKMAADDVLCKGCCRYP